ERDGQLRTLPAVALRPGQLLPVVVLQPLRRRTDVLTGTRGLGGRWRTGARGAGVVGPGRAGGAGGGCLGRPLAARREQQRGGRDEGRAQAAPVSWQSAHQALPSVGHPRSPDARGWIKEIIIASRTSNGAPLATSRWRARLMASRARRSSSG